MITKRINKGECEEIIAFDMQDYVEAFKAVCNLDCKLRLIGVTEQFQSIRDCYRMIQCQMQKRLNSFDVENDLSYEIAYNIRRIFEGES